MSVEPAPGVDLRCPFCESPVTDRIDLEGRRFLVFRCLFTPEIDPKLSDAEIAHHLKERYNGPAGAYFQRTCDRLHLYVTKGAGARALLAPDPAGASR
jgi:hypothetical protein